MEYVVGKSFLRNGERYRPGDKPPGDLDKVTQDHYLRHGMLSAGKPSQTKPASAGRSARPSKDKPAETKPAGPADTTQTLQAEAAQQPATPVDSKGDGPVAPPAHGEAGQPAAPSTE